MSIGRGRVVRGADVAGAARAHLSPHVAPQPARPPRRVPGAVVDAHASARAILEDAARRAEAHLEEARSRARDVAEAASREAREAETAKLAASFVALREAERRRDEAALARTTELAKLLAERLIGEELRASPEVIASCARRALDDARGARRVRIEACPASAAELERHAHALGVAAVEISARDDLAPGDLVLHTDLGTLDARLTPQLERFAAALRDALADAERGHA